MSIILLALALAAQAIPASAIELRTGRVLEVEDRTIPPDLSEWSPANLPHADAPSGKAARAGAAWYRLALPAVTEENERHGRVVYLPYLYHGGEVWLNGTLITTIPEGDTQRRVRWERPHLVPLPPALLGQGTNELAVRAANPPPGTIRRFPVVSVGARTDLQPAYDRRFFWVRTLPQITIAVCFLMSIFVVIVWWRRRSEVLYGLFGLAAALWGVRTLTFVIEEMSYDRWHLWRVAYLGATGGFVIVLTLFALRSAGIRSRWLQRGLVLYWLAGPLWLLAAGPDAEGPVNRIWSAGLIPIALGMLAVALQDALRRRTLQAAVLPGAMAVAIAAGIHDYLVAWRPDVLAHIVPGWVDHRIFLLHLGADIVLVAMGGLLTARFIQALASIEDLNRNLEARVAERERQLAGNFVAMGELQQRHAAAQERHRVMRDIHDGLGSRLFASLFRVQRGALNQAQMAEALRECIAEMRLSLDALGPDDDFRTALGNFLFRWQTQMQEAGVASSWTIDMPDDAHMIQPHAALQFLRIAQEALTNVLKHARAAEVQVTVRQSERMLALDVVDDGRGATGAANPTGRGLGNMRMRATQLGGQLDVQMSEHGTRVSLRIPLPLERPEPAVLN